MSGSPANRVPSRVHVDYRKYPNTKHWQHTLRVLGADRHGLWLGAQPGQTARRGDEPPITIEHAFVQLVLPGAWWSPIFNPAGPLRVYVDIVSPATWSAAGRVLMTDLDLDVVVAADGSVSVVDEDEFDSHRVIHAYPDALVAGARTGCREVEALIRAGHPPFGGEAEDWLRRNVALSEAGRLAPRNSDDTDR